ncbi:MAG TPA: hypothetical protein VEO00_03830 [Actinomycetota bacterium]|nr:hypothetical protein [Actinomycetota bacterium]
MTVETYTIRGTPAATAASSTFSVPVTFVADIPGRSRCGMPIV